MSCLQMEKIKKLKCLLYLEQEHLSQPPKYDSKKAAYTPIRASRTKGSETDGSTKVWIKRGVTDAFYQAWKASGSSSSENQAGISMWISSLKPDTQSRGVAAFPPSVWSKVSHTLTWEQNPLPLNFYIVFMLQQEFSVYFVGILRNRPTWRSASVWKRKERNKPCLVPSIIVINSDQLLFSSWRKTSPQPNAATSRFSLTHLPLHSYCMHVTAVKFVSQQPLKFEERSHKNKFRITRRNMSLRLKKILGFHAKRKASILKSLTLQYKYIHER